MLILSVLLSGCRQPAGKRDDKVIFTSILPLKYFADQVAGNLYRTEVMVPPGVGPETYNPTPRQMGELSKARIYFANGFLGFEEAYIGKFQSVNSSLMFVNTSEGVNLIHSDEHEHAGHVHEKGIDPHTWSSPEGARIIARNMLDAMVKADPANKTAFEANYRKLIARIDSVDLAVKGILDNLPSRQFMVFHPALGYYARQYGLNQLSIEFEGKIPSPRHLQEIILTARENKIANILIQKEFDIENAEIIARETGSRVVQIDPLSYDWPGEMVTLARKMAGNR